MGLAQYTFARNGLLVYAPGGANDLSQLVSRIRSGRVDTLPFEPAQFGCISLSPDGNRIAARVADPATGQWDVWVYDLANRTSLRLTSTGGLSCPGFSPDGRVTYLTRSGVEATISAQSATGRESPTTVATLRLNGMVAAARWSPDGKRIAVYPTQDSSGSDVLVYDLDGGALHPVATTPALEWGGVFSPDGRWIAYSSSESGTDDIYVQPWPVTGQRWRISRNGGEEPLWTRGGSELVYRSGQEWWSVRVTRAGTFMAGEPELLARGPWLNVAGVEYAVTPDGERLYLLAPMAGPATTTTLTVVSNWFATLRDLSRRASHE
jgi:serine/threonine-protein kinase